MKLEIGAGRKKRKGYKTLDINPDFNPDYLMDMTEAKPDAFSDLEVIRMHHVLEHFSRKESVKVLMTVAGWLAPGGVFVCETPDMYAMCAEFQNDPDHIAVRMYADQKTPWDFHKDGWYYAKYEEMFKRVGLEIFDCTQGEKGRDKHLDMTVFARKKE